MKRTVLCLLLLAGVWSCSNTGKTPNDAADDRRDASSTGDRGGNGGIAGRGNAGSVGTAGADGGAAAAGGSGGTAPGTGGRGGTGGSGGANMGGSGGTTGGAGGNGGNGMGSDAGGMGGQPGMPTWSAPASLVDDLGRLAVGNQLHVVGHSNGQLVHRRSSDNGASWSQPKTIAPAAGNFPAMYGGLYADGDTLYLVTSDQDMDSSANAGGRTVRIRRSDNNGDTWTTPVTVNSSSSPMFRGRVAAYQNFVHIVGTAKPTPNASLWYFRSQDRGATWTAVELASDLGSYGGGQTVAVDGPVVHIAYTDAKGSVGAGPTLYIRSTNNGQTWSQPVTIGETSAASSRQARVQLTAADGRVFACWQRERSSAGATFPTDRLGYNTSSDKGVTWGTARVLPEDTGIDRNHQHIWMAPGGGVHIVWRHGDSADNVNDPAGYKYSPDYGATWRPRVIAIDTTGSGGTNHPWAIVANATAVHILTGPQGKMQYARRTGF
jgi:hypothetical protein